MPSVFLPIALAAVGFSGFATQRGNTCAVVAMERIVSARRYDKLLAILDASLWVACGLAALNAWGLMPAVPLGYAPALMTILGGALFGLGAMVNGACAFGTIARLGSGEWAYLATPAGYCCGFRLAARWPNPQTIPDGAWLLDVPGWIALPAASLLVVRLALLFRRRYGRGERTPYAASAVIGLSSLAVAMTIDNWTYTDFLGELAEGTVRHALLQMLLCLVLLSGAVLGGWTAQRLTFVPPNLPSLARRLAG
jgi:toxin CptA